MKRGNTERDDSRYHRAAFKMLGDLFKATWNQIRADLLLEK